MDAKVAAGEAKAAEAAAKAAAAQAAAVAGQLPPKAEERLIPDDFGWMHGASAYTKCWKIKVTPPSPEHGVRGNEEFLEKKRRGELLGRGVANDQTIF